MSHQLLESLPLQTESLDRVILAITKYRAEPAMSSAVIAGVTAVGERYVEIMCIGGRGPRGKPTTCQKELVSRSGLKNITKVIIN